MQNTFPEPVMRNLTMESFIYQIEWIFKKNPNLRMLFAHIHAIAIGDRQSRPNVAEFEFVCSLFVHTIKGN
jgi:hypothetical protein